MSFVISDEDLRDAVGYWACIATYFDGSLWKRWAIIFGLFNNISIEIFLIFASIYLRSIGI